MNFDRSDWQYYAVMLFAVLSGQIARLGYKAENGDVITRRQMMIELTMLSPFVSLGGAYAAEHEWSIVWILASGLGAGWLGFALLKLLGEAFMAAVRGRVQGK
jgi:uncharacterized membrane protein YbjE (DUF340 family)